MLSFLAVVGWLVVVLLVTDIKSFPTHHGSMSMIRRNEVYRCRVPKLGSTAGSSSTPSATSTTDVRVYPTAEDVGRALCVDFIDQARLSIAARGAFYVAVPGGSVLKLLSGLRDSKTAIDWSKVYLFYVNHKCVPDNDPSATHFKAKALFLDHLGTCNAFSILQGSEGVNAMQCYCMII